MARGSTQASDASTTANANAKNLNANASSLYGTLAPELATEAAHPAGFGPTDLAAMNTASQQSTGGSQAAAVGQGALLAGRTRNAGTADAAIAESTRSAGRNLGEEALQTQTKNSLLKQTQRRSALSGLESLYGTNVSGGNQALGEVANNVNANTNAQNASWNWAKYLLDPAIAAAGSAKYPGT